MRTFKNLQDAVLNWMADSNDTGLLRTLVSDAINRSHQNLLNDDRYDFMLWPRVETISVVADQKVYALHPRFGHPLFFYNPTTDEYMEEIAPKGLLESGEDWQDAQVAEPERFMLTGLQKLLAQPAASDVVTVTTSGGTESSANSIIVTGTYNGAVVTETLSSGSSWASLVGSQSFDVIEDITKVGATWTRSVTVTVGATTVLSLGATDFGRQYRTFELVSNPSQSASIQYRFFRQPRQLEEDNDIPDLPMGFDDILVYGALIAMHGYTRATEAEMSWWASQQKTLINTMQETYRSTRTMGARPVFTRYIPRV
jgi:hypothetical protein